MRIRIPKPWETPGLAPTPEAAFLDRRRFLRRLGAGATGALLGPRIAAARPRVPTAEEEDGEQGSPLDPVKMGMARPGEVWPDFGDRYPAPQNDAFSLEPDRPLTDERVAASYNNFYEFSEEKGRVKELVGPFRPWPWAVEIGGLVREKGPIDVEELVRKMPLEERLYRFRCVEAWAMAVPWTGFPFKALMDRVEPLSSARYVRFLTFLRPKQAIGQRTMDWYDWPYYEGLTIEEAACDLTLLATGIYGHPLPKQHGAPLRLVVPWKYGFKSIKSIARIEFVAEQPRTFWNDLQPTEYDFRANVDPEVPHPRWSQATERMIPSLERRPTLKYNGYGELVSHLYA